VTDLPGGAYEHVVTRGLQRQLVDVDTDLIQRTDLDPADSHVILSRHISGLTHRALRSVPGQGAGKLAAQVELANRIADTIAAVLPRAIENDDRVGTSHDLLTAIATRPVALPSFLTDTGIELEDLYRRKAWGGWSGLCREAGLDPSTGIDDTALSAAIGRMLHIDDPDRLTGLRKIIDGAAPTGRLAAMLKNSLWGQSSTLEEGVAKLIANARRRDELRQIADILGQRIHRVTKRVDPLGHVPLHVHARYSKDEACIAMGFPDPSSFREGVKWLPDEGVDFFFVTLRKTEQHYSPTTMYQDRAITADLFQWESQSTIATTSKTGQRYVNGGSSVHLFLREHKEPDGDLGVPPYLYAGPMTYVSHTGDRPMRIRWRLATPLPADMFHAARVAAG
jgi:hypothetical protein